MSEAAPRHLLLGAAGAGLVAAASLPGERPGLGVLLTTLAAAAAVRAARREDSGWAAVWICFAVAFAAIAVLRDASWVVVPSMGAAVALLSVTVAGGSTWRSLARGAVAAPLGLPRAGAAVAAAGVDAIPAGAGRRAAPAVRGVLIAAPLLAIFGLLFASGDRAFAQIAEESLPTDVDLGLLPVRALVFVLIAALAGALVLARRATSAPSRPTRTLSGAEWAIPLAALNVLFAAFVAVQFAVLFGGDDRVLRTAGLTYAEYAREGYGQLLVAAVLTLAVVAGALRYARGDRRLLRALLAVLCVLTGVVLASALHRLDLYQDAFGATRLRVTATATLLWLGAVLALVLGALATDRYALLPRVSLLLTALAGLSFALWNPDLRIAERNLARSEVDRAYLRTLSADAAPALPPELRAPRASDGWGGWNLARR